MISVLHIDDDPDFADLTAEYLQREDERMSVQTATNANQGLEYLFESEFDCIVSDYAMPELTGIELFETIREDHPDLPFILYTGKGSEEVASEAISAGVTDYLQKVDGTEQYELLAKKIVSAVEKFRTEQELDVLRRQYTQLVEQNFVGIYIIQDGEFVYVNPRLAEIHGYDDPEEVIGMSPLDLVTPEERDKVQTNLERRIMDEVAEIQYQTKGLRKDGERIDIQLHGSRITLEGEPAVIGAELNVTERLERERQLKESNETYASLFHGINDAIFVHNLDGEIVAVNETAMERLGYSEAELLRKTPADLDAAEHAEKIDSRIDTLTNEGTNTFESVHVAKSGKRVPVEISASVIDYYGEDHVLSVARDISARKESEQDLKLFRNLIDEANDSVFVIDETTGTFIDVNATACEMLGYERDEMLDLTVPDISLKFDSLAEYVDHIGNEDNQTINSMIHQHRRADGSTIPVEVSAKSVSIGEDRYRIAIGRDISERLEREQELRRMNRAVEASGHAIYLTDPDGTIEYVNPAFEEVTGYTKKEAIGANPRILNSGEMSDEYFEELWETVVSGEVWEEEVTNRRKNGTLYTAHQTIAPIFDRNQAIEGFVAIQTDITERKRQKSALAKRERILRELHSTTQEFIEADDESDIFDGIVDALSNALDLSLFGVMEFDQDQGRLETRAVSSELAEIFRELPTLEPSDNPLWKVFRDGKSRMFSELAAHWLPDDIVESVTNLLVVPIGDFGLIYTTTTETESIEEEDIELIDLLAANAETVLNRMSRESQLSNVSQELSVQESRVDELEELIKVVETIQHRLAVSDTKEALEKAVCEELVATERIEFAWIGQPEIDDTQLSPAAWAGSDQGFLDAISMDSGEGGLPSQRAAASRQTVSISNISTNVSRSSWAMEAISRGFRSTLSIPLLHNDVLYGVLTLYSNEQEAYDSLYQNVFEDVASLFTQYLTIANKQFAEGGGHAIELEFRLSDRNYPLHLLAVNSGGTIEFETVLKSSEETVSILVTVGDGEPENVVEVATELASIAEAKLFGDSKNNKIHLVLWRPFLATEVTPHGGRLISSIATPDGTSARINLPEGVSVRPLAESLAKRYQDIELIARRETPGGNNTEPVRTEEVLTDRQQEILKAAYHGGYYETPRGVTGQDLAESFDISNSVIHGHLQAAHKQIIERILDSDSDNEGRNI